MKEIDIDSVQFINGTDYDRREINSFIAQKTHYPGKAPCFYRFRNPAWLSDQTLHSLWQVRMQVRRGSWSRPQTLSICQLSRPQAGTGICDTEVRGSSKAISGQLPEDETNIRRDLQHQSRALTTERNIVKDLYEYHHRYLYTQGYWCFGDLSGQYATGFYCRGFQRNRFTGGDR